MGPFHCRREDPPAALPAALTGDASGSCVADCVAAGVRKCGTALDRPSHKWMDAFDTWDHCSYFGPVICGRKSSRSLLKKTAPSPNYGHLRRGLVYPIQLTI